MSSLVLESFYASEAARAELRRVEADIDRAAAALWGLTDQELADIQASLQELKGQAEVAYDPRAPSSSNAMDASHIVCRSA